jgi:glutathione synthase/RimK-type ligase-like ATP-grasp enzyme
MTSKTHNESDGPHTTGTTTGHGEKSLKFPTIVPEKADIALLTDHRYTATQAAANDWYLGNILHDDALLQKALADLGLSSIRVDWADPTINWTTFSCAVFRTTWDYYERITEFTTWLDRVEKQTRLCNDVSLIRWNLDKHYLADLQSSDIPVVPSLFLEAGTRPELTSLLDETGWQEAIIKPCISGTARHTYRINRSSAGRIQQTLEPLLTSEAFILQPFLPDVVKNGEDTLVLINGTFTHAVTKKPKPGDFRVQDDHGGTVHPCHPTTEQIELAERAFTACRSENRPVPVYGRVDMVRDQRGSWRVMELELIEPELWLRNHPPAARTLAESIVRFLKEKS